MSKAIRKGKMYQSGMTVNHCKYLERDFQFDHEQVEKYPKLIRNGKTVRV